MKARGLLFGAAFLKEFSLLHFSRWSIPCPSFSYNSLGVGSHWRCTLSLLRRAATPPPPYLDIVRFVKLIPLEKAIGPTLCCNSAQLECFRANVKTQSHQSPVLQSMDVAAAHLICHTLGQSSDHQCTFIETRVGASTSVAAAEFLPWFSNLLP
jgi:hypothetical protein